MADPSYCVRCGTEVTEGLSADGICPNCLLTLGLASAAADDDQPTVSVSPGSARRPTQGQLLASGETFGTYRIERLLGRGGMGEVYEAEDESGRRLALKVLTHGLDDPQDRARFLREGRLAASINHPHTVYVYGTEEIEGIPVITMELVGGGTLKDKVKEAGPLAPTEAVDLILQVIDGLEAAAAADILHRDMKPSNCFVDSDGSVKVGDFGLSISTLARTEHDLTELTFSGTFLGTPVFASPEQLRADELDLRSDVYSVGATLFYLLTGRPPFQEANVLKLATMIGQEPAPPIAQVRPGVPTGLGGIVSGCLAKAPSERYPTYAALRKDLEAFSSMAPQTGRPGLRFAAGVVDWFVVGVLLTPFTIFLQWLSAGPPTGMMAIIHELAYLFVTAMYFALPESRRGRTLGKTLCGLRVVGPDGLRPNLRQALGRGLIFATALRCYELATPGGVGAPFPGTALTWFVGLNFNFTFQLPGVEWYLVILLLFVMARRRSGFRGVHELITHSRVITDRSADGRPPAQRLPDIATSTPATTRIGPFQVIERLSADLLLGYDGRLRRRVWIHLVPSGTPSLARVQPARYQPAGPPALANGQATG